MKYLQTFALFENNNSDKQIIYRNTAFKWLLDFLKKGEVIPYMGKKRFISLSFKEDSGGSDDFGDTRVVFDAKMLFKQGAIEIEYDDYFFEENPDICAYITGFKSEDEYYRESGYEGKKGYEENAQDDSNVLSWNVIIEDYENEAEVVIKKIKYLPGLIKHVIVPKGTSEKELDVRFYLQVI